MRKKLRAGEQFADVELRNHEGEPTKLSSLIGARCHRGMKSPAVAVDGQTLTLDDALGRI
jgi:hypothetical protein